MRVVTFVCLIVLVLVPGLDARDLLKSRKGRKKYKTLHCDVAKLGSSSCPGIPAVAPETVDAKVQGGVNLLAPQWTLFPYAVSLTDAAGLSICSGFALTSTYIITAAQCLYANGQWTVPTSIFIPSPGPGGQTKQATLTDLYINQGAYIPGSNQWDIGVIRVSPLSAAGLLPKIPVKGASASYVPGSVLSLAGWGITQFNANDNGFLRIASLAYVKDIIGSTIKAGNVPTQASACRGDWGAPLVAWSKTVASHVVVGIFSSGPRCLPTAISGDSFAPVGTFTDLSNADIQNWLKLVGVPIEQVVIPPNNLTG